MRFGVENFDQLEQFVLHLHEACLAECGIPGHGVQVLAQRSEPAVEARAGKSLHECGIAQAFPSRALRRPKRPWHEQHLPKSSLLPSEDTEMRVAIVACG